MSLDPLSKARFKMNAGKPPDHLWSGRLTPAVTKFFDALYSGELTWFRPWTDLDLYRDLRRTQAEAFFIVWGELPDLDAIRADRDLAIRYAKTRKDAGFTNEHCGTYLKGRTDSGAKPRWVKYLLNPKSHEAKKRYDRDRQRRLRADKRGSAEL
jgi:hypothetical protein